MPQKHWFNEALGIWEMHTDGAVSLDEVTAALGDIYRRLDVGRPFLLLWQSAADVDLLASSDLRLLMEFVAENRPDVDGWTAIVALDDATYGMSRVAQIYGESVVPHMCAFRDRDEALAWLLSAG